MAVVINKKTLEHLAELARIDLKPYEEKKLLKDLQGILDYFQELKELDTKDIEPLTGIGQIIQKNTFRDDKVDLERRQKEIGEVGRILETFPETEGRFLKTPPVFE